MISKKIILILSIAGLGIASGAFAQQADTASTKSQTTTATTSSRTTATKGDRATYRAAKKQANDTYKTAKQQCDSLSGRGKADCIGIAKAEQKLAKANAEAQYKPTDKNMMNAKLAAAEVDYTKAKAKCDSIPGNVQSTGNEVDLCMSRAAETRNQAIAAAKASKESADSGKVKAPNSSMDTKGDIGKK